MDKTFFLDIFNKLLKYEDKEISIIFDSNGDVWFGLRDTLKVLDYKNYKKALQNIYISKNNRKKQNKINLPKVPLEGYLQKNKHPDTIFINESGLYQLLSNSTKPIAKLFMNKYFKHQLYGFQYMMPINEYDIQYDFQTYQSGGKRFTRKRKYVESRDEQ